MSNYAVILFDTTAKKFLRLEKMFKNKESAKKHAHKLNQMISRQVVGEAVVYNMETQQLLQVFAQ